MSYFNNKVDRIKKAKEHTKYVSEKYSKETEYSINNTRTYIHSPIEEYKSERTPIKIKLWGIDSVSAVIRSHYENFLISEETKNINDRNKKIAVLNFASFKHPGGMFLEGSSAQEESLCHESNLYNILSSFKNTYYYNNSLYTYKNLYCNKALYSPNVVFERDDYRFLCDVITCAAPNKRAGQQYNHVTDEENYQIWDAMGVPRTTDGVFQKDSEAPFSSDGMVTFAQAIREGKMDIHTKDFAELTGDTPISVRYMFDHQEEFQIGERHSQDK